MLLALRRGASLASSLSQCSVTETTVLHPPPPLLRGSSRRHRLILTPDPQPHSSVYSLLRGTPTVFPTLDRCYFSSISSVHRVQVQTDEIQLIQDQVLSVEAEIKAVGQQIAEVESEIKTTTDTEKKKQLRAKENRLLDKKTQLREEKNKLLDARNILLNKTSPAKEDQSLPPKIYDFSSIEAILQSVQDIARDNPTLLHLKDEAHFCIPHALDSSPLQSTTGSEVLFEDRGQSIEEALEQLTLHNKPERVAISAAQGAPGSGKTAFIDHLAARLADVTNPTCLALPVTYNGTMSKTVPTNRFDIALAVRVLYSAFFAAKTDTAWDDFVRLVSPCLPSVSLRTALNAALKISGKERVVLLIDEISKARIEGAEDDARNQMHNVVNETLRAATDAADGMGTKKGVGSSLLLWTVVSQLSRLQTHTAVSTGFHCHCCRDYPRRRSWRRSSQIGTTTSGRH